MRFVDLSDAGRQLALRLVAADEVDTLVVSVPPGGVPVGVALGDAIGRVVIPLVADHHPDGVSVRVPLDVAGRRVLVVDAGVETGTTARAVAAALRERGAAHLVLAVPVCPREVEVDLRRRYDDVIAVTRPLARRSLRWHYETFA